MDPIDPAAIDFRMAQTLADMNQTDRAKHHVLRALQEAPRYRDAHRLLLKLTEKPTSKPPKADGDEDSAVTGSDQYL